jgi:hypothetical protein
MDTSSMMWSLTGVLAYVFVLCCRTPGSDGRQSRAGRVASSGPDQVLAADQDRDV